LQVREPLIIPFAAVAAGVAIATYCALPVQSVVFGGVACAGFAVLAHRSARSVFWLAVVTALLLGGAALVASRRPSS